jgi:exodeoxyribonuclease VII large subunit
LLNSSAGTTLDALVLTRGGGSATDLAWFNDEKIARTIAQLPWPVISGIGHEIDMTLPDYASHTRAKTPTHAASILVDIVARFDDRLSGLSRSLVTNASPRIQVEYLKVKNMAGNLAIHLASLPSRKSQAVQRLSSLMNLALVTKLSQLHSCISEMEKQIEMRDPLKMLNLGWAVVRDGNGRPVRSADSINPGERITVSMNRGSLKALVEEKTNG